MDVIDIRPLFIRMTSCIEVRIQLLLSHVEDVLNDHEVLLLYDLNRSNILDLTSDSFPDFNFDDLETTSAYPNFVSSVKRDLIALNSRRVIQWIAEKMSY